eukprot:CAMPEP_0197185000 /NCGR_PEP_ID=MMETSP1423-20130617/11038_1 /TAXON_ID=476441 /ORGANISM="Pseudo-nitzschia heimii, Strain UNC1101" /LENGTH=1116 /DNA_ID=CAMNT_0042635959 /DNA_START=220 /DNA_END=3570 /DNA_ORIENTATION=+
MGKARSQSSRERLSKSLAATATVSSNSGIQENAYRKNTHYYKSFPMVRRISGRRSGSPSGSVSRSSDRNPNKIFTVGLLRTKKKSREFVEEDPGNPVGNAVDFCVNNFQSLHTRSLDMSSLLSSCPEPKTLLSSCPEFNVDQFLADLFLCNLHLSTNGNDPNGESNDERGSARNGFDGKNQDNPSLLSSSGYSKKGKQHWKTKSLTIIPGKKLLTSMSLKGKKSSLTNSLDVSPNGSPSDIADGEHGLGSMGSKEEAKAGLGLVRKRTKETIQSCDSEDSIFANLADDGNPAMLAPQQSKNSRETSAEVSGLPFPLSLRSLTTASTASDEEETNKKKMTKISINNVGEYGSRDDEGLDQQSFNSDDGNNCQLCFCALPETAEDGTIDPIQGSYASEQGAQHDEQDDVEVKPSKPTIDGTKIPNISIVPQSVQVKRRTKNIENTTTSRNINNAHSINEEEEDLEPKMEYEMILDDSRFGGRKWRKITPWKKLFPDTRSTDTSSTSDTHHHKKRMKRRSLSMDDGSKSTEIMDPNLRRRNERIMKRRLLRSVLQSSVSSKGIKPKRSSWRKMLVFSVPKRERQTSANPKQGDSQVKITKQSNEIPMIPKLKAIEEDCRSGDMSVDTANRTTSTYPLQYSQSYEEETTKSDTGNQTKAKDPSSTSVMGLHEWSWSVCAMDLRNNHDTEFRDDPDSNLLTRGSIEDRSFERDKDSWSQHDEACCQKDSEGNYYYHIDEDYSTDHDHWIMDEDELDSYDTRRTSEYSYKTSSITINAYSNDDIDEAIDKEFQAVVSGAGSYSDEDTIHFESKRQKISNFTHKRRAYFVAALSRSIRKSFYKKKSKASIDISNDVSVEATEQDAAGSVGDGSKCTTDTNHLDSGNISNETIEVILRTKPTKSMKGSTTITFPDGRDDASTVFEAGNGFARNSIAARTRSNLTHMKFKKFWKDQNKSQSSPTTVTTQKFDVVDTTTNTRGKRVGLKRSNATSISSSSNNTPGEIADETHTNDHITVITKNRSASSAVSAVSAVATILTQKSNDILDQYATFFDKYDDEYDSEYSFQLSSSDSRSWAGEGHPRSCVGDSDENSWSKDDDEVVGPDAFRFKSEKSCASPHDIIRE